MKEVTKLDHAMQVKFTINPQEVLSKLGDLVTGGEVVDNKLYLSVSHDVGVTNLCIDGYGEVTFTQDFKKYDGYSFKISHSNMDGLMGTLTKYLTGLRDIV